MPDMLVRWLRKAIVLWESTQVELQGLYPPQRVLAFHAYAEETSLLRAILVLLATPLPCLVITTLVDCVDLHPWAEGLRANGLFVVREFFSYCLFGILATDQFRHSMQSLPLSNLRVMVNATVVAVLVVGFLYGFGLVVGFPVPFTIVTAAPVWVSLLSLSMAVSWAQKIRADPGLQQLLINTLKVWMCQVGIVVLYPTYFYVLTTLPEAAKTPFTFLLPVMKIALRNVFVRTVVHLHDEMPEVVVFNVEVFNALFLAYAMQNSPSMWTTAGLMIMDLVQLAAVLRDISIILDELKLLEQKLDPETTRPVPKQSARGPNVGQRETAIVDRAVARLMRQGAPTGATGGSSSRAAAPLKGARSESAEAETGVSPLAGEQKIQVKSASRSPGFSSIPSTEPPTRTVSLAKVAVADHELYRVKDRGTPSETQYLQNVQRLLYTTEFVALINFVEVIIPLVFGTLNCLRLDISLRQNLVTLPSALILSALLSSCVHPRSAIYLVVIYNLPNCAYYPQFAKMDSEQLYQTLQSVLFYLAMQIVSLATLTLVLSRYLGLSAIQQLAFVLEKQWGQVQVKLVFWVYYNVQASLEHFGYDYTFRFEWLHASKTAIKDAARSL